MAKWADHHGFSTLVVSEHHCVDDGFLPSPPVLAGALASCTESVGISVSALLAPLHDPIRLAEDVAVLDLVSGGRVTIVAGLGYRPVEYAALGKRFDRRGRLLEECLEGPEVSVFALCDGERLVLLPPAQDHKRIGEGDTGPNTGGMGAYAPAPLLDEAGLQHVREIILEPVVQALRQRGIDYRGVIYAGLMLTSSGPQVIEFNCRFGDPECQTLMPLLQGDLAEVLLACANGQLDQAPALTIAPLCSACVVAAAAGYPGTPQLGDLISDEGPGLGSSGEASQLFCAGVKADANSGLQTSGGRVLAAVAQGHDFDEAFAKAYGRLAKVNFSGMQLRRDIGHQVRRL